MKLLNRRLLIGLVSLILPHFAYPQPIQVGFPDSVTGDPGTSVTIPILVEDLTGRGVFAYQTVIIFDAGVLDATGASVVGTLSEPFGPPFVDVTVDGEIILRNSGNFPLSGRGVLVNINFDVEGQPGDMTDLEFLGFQFNTGDPPEATVNGKFIVNAQPDIAINPKSNDFGEVYVDSTVDQKFVISNNGTDDLEITAVNFGGTNPEQFDITRLTVPLLIPPDDSQFFFVTFTPRSVSEKTAILEILSNDPDDPSVAIQLSGNGAGKPEIAVSPSFLEFGEVTLDTFAIKAFTVNNIGLGELLVNSTELLGMDADQFVIKSRVEPFTIPPQDSQIFLVGFKPTSESAKEAALQIVSNDPDDETLEIRLNGIGVPVPQPEISITPTSLNFGEVTVDSISTLDVVISNEGTAQLEVNGANLVGDNADQFAIESGNLPFVVAAGASQNLQVNFKPTAAGIKNASLQILSNDPDEDTLNVALTGIGVGTLEITTTINFPSDGALVCEDSAIVEVTSTIDGGVNPFVLNCIVNGITAVRFNKTFIAKVPVVAGENLLVATCSVTDSLGTEAIASDSIVVNGATNPVCNLEIISPQDNSIINTDHIMVTAMMSVTSGTPPFSVSCEINGVTASSQDSLFTATVPCPEGELLIVATCTVDDSCEKQAVCVDSIRVDCLPLQQNILFGVDKDDKMLVKVDVNAANPEVIKLGNILSRGEKVAEMEAMTFDLSAGKILIISNSKGGRLFAFNPADIPNPPNMKDIPAELIGITGSTHIDGIAFDPLAGQLFGADTETDEFLKIDRVTAAVTSIGPLAFGNVEGLTFTRDPEPVLYGVDNEENKLITVNSSTGKGTAVSENKVGFDNVECLAFSPDGQLFGFSNAETDKFITIDVETGIGSEFSTIGTNGLDIEGLSFFNLDPGIAITTNVDNVERLRPQTFHLAQNYPNPFNPSTNITFDIPENLTGGIEVQFRIYNILGNLVRTLLKEHRQPGRHTVAWDGRNQNGEIVPSGVYIYQLAAKDLIETKRMILLK